MSQSQKDSFQTQVARRGPGPHMPAPQSAGTAQWPQAQSHPLPSLCTLDSLMPVSPCYFRTCAKTAAAGEAVSCLHPSALNHLFVYLVFPSHPSVTSSSSHAFSSPLCTAAGGFVSTCKSGYVLPLAKPFACFLLLSKKKKKCRCGLGKALFSLQNF